MFPARATGYSRDLRVSVFDTGDLDDEDEAPRYPIGPGYWSQNMQGSPLPDRWSSWRDDFFIPSTRLLMAAPWLPSRVITNVQPCRTRLVLLCSTRHRRYSAPAADSRNARRRLRPIGQPVPGRRRRRAAVRGPAVPDRIERALSSATG